MGDPAQDFLDSGGQTTHPLDAANDATAAAPATAAAKDSADPAQAFLDSGGKSEHPLSKTEKSEKSPTLWERYKGFQEGQLAGATGGVASLAGGLSYLGDRLLLGKTDDEAQADKAKVQSDLTYAPRTEEGKKNAAGMSEAASYLGEKEGKAAGGATTDFLTRHGASPEVAGAAGSAAETLANVPQYVLPAALERGGSGALPAPIRRAGPSVGPAARTSGAAVSEAPAPSPATAGLPASGQRLLPAPEPTPLSATGAERTPYFDINDPQSASELGIKPEKVEAQAPSSTGNLSPEQQAARKALAARVGLKEVRTSAINGDAQAAADDFDSTKYTDDPMGDRMRGVIKNERAALTQHAEGIIDDLGARQGTDQSTLIAKGKTMAAPLDALANHIDAATTKAYEAAKEKGGTDPIEFPTLEKALTDKTLTNSLLAQGKEGFLKGVQSQWDDFKANNPEGVNAGVAEQYRQFLNTLWKTNPEAVGKLKNAMDTDMHSHFGENIFGEARQLHQLGHTLLENPKGVAQISGKDPNAPVNRTTAYEDIPDKVANMSGDQFKNLVNTYKMMPEEIQPQAQAALGEIQGHMVNRLLDAGSKHETQWNKKGVNNELANNSENFKTAFADNPEAAAKIKDLKDAGEMLRFNSGYRGAHAQASNMTKSGVGTAAQGAGGAIGAGIGSWTAGPLGAMPGAVVGRAAVSKGLGMFDKRAIRKQVESRVTQVGDQ